MKKLVTFLIIFFCLTISVSAKEKKEVTFSSCTDGDTASVILGEEEIKLRFLAIDTPESVHPTIEEEPYGKEASNYTCEALENADKIEIEYDADSDKTDKYDRHLVWIFVNGELLQEKLIEEGLAEVAYLYGDYKYTSILEAKQLIAKTNKVGMWNDSEEIDCFKIIVAVIVMLACIVLFFTNQNFRKKATTKIKNKAKKELKNLFKN